MRASVKVVQLEWRDSCLVPSISQTMSLSEKIICGMYDAEENNCSRREFPIDKVPHESVNHQAVAGTLTD